MSNAPIIRAAAPGDQPIIERILCALPDWFGIEESLVQYVRDSAVMESSIAEVGGSPAGFITLNHHFPRASEIHCIAVMKEHHRSGVGRALVEHAERVLRGRGVEFLQVKTLGPSRPCEFYDRTRRFYEGIGFVALEEFKTLWPGNPALQLVKRL